MKKKARRKLAAQAFAALPRQEQSLLILHSVLGLTDEEISRRTGISGGELRLRRELCQDALFEKIRKAGQRPKSPRVR